MCGSEDRLWNSKHGLRCINLKAIKLQLQRQQFIDQALDPGARDLYGQELGEDKLVFVRE